MKVRKTYVKYHQRSINGWRHREATSYPFFGGDELWLDEHIRLSPTDFKLFSSDTEASEEETKLYWRYRKLRQI